MWEWLEALENQAGPVLWDGALLQWPALPLPQMGGNPGKLEWEEPGIREFRLFWCRRSDPGTAWQELLRLPPCAPSAPALLHLLVWGCSWNGRPEDASHPAGRTSSCFLRTQGFMDFLQQRPKGLLHVASVPAGISELPRRSCFHGSPVPATAAPAWNLVLDGDFPLHPTRMRRQLWKVWVTQPGPAPSCCVRGVGQDIAPAAAQNGPFHWEWAGAVPPKLGRGVGKLTESWNGLG